MQSKIELKRQIGKKPDDILDYLENLLEDDSTILNLILTIKSNFQHIKSQNMQGLLSFEDYNRSMTKIRLNILDIIDELPDKYFVAKQEAHTEIEKSAGHDTALFEVSKLIRDLSKINVAQTKLTNDYKDVKAGKQMNIQKQIINDQIIKFAEIYNIILSVSEYTLIADTFRSTADYAKAEVYYKKAIDHTDAYTDSAVAKIAAIRGYALFLYQMNRPEEGLAQFESAILEGESQQAQVLNGLTYNLIFTEEAIIKNYESAVAAYAKAKACFLNVNDLSVRRNHMIELENAWVNNIIPKHYTRP